MDNISKARSSALEKISKATLREWIASVAGPRQWAASERWLRLAAERCDVSFRTMRSLHYADITDPDHPAVKKLRETAERYEAESLADQFDGWSRKLRGRARLNSGNDAQQLRTATGSAAKT